MDSEIFYYVMIAAIWLISSLFGKKNKKDKKKNQPPPIIQPKPNPSRPQTRPQTPPQNRTLKNEPAEAAPPAPSRRRKQAPKKEAVGQGEFEKMLREILTPPEEKSNTLEMEPPPRPVKKAPPPPAPKPVFSYDSEYETEDYDKRKQQQLENVLAQNRNTKIHHIKGSTAHDHQNTKGITAPAYMIGNKKKKKKLPFKFNARDMMVYQVIMKQKY